MKKYDLIMPTIKEDAEKVLLNIDYLKKYLNFNNLIIIGNDEVEKLIIKNKDKKVKFINENKMIDSLNFLNVKEAIKNRNGNVKRTGWYFQQFLKLSYALVAKTEYYMSWDSDTIPVKKVDMFNNKVIPYFDMKKEYNKPYFDTIKTLLNIEKNEKKSFISEHMIFKTEYVKELIKKIENNNRVKGDSFWEKIINSINIKDLDQSGFSEFETYGTYIMAYHKDSYELRDWKSLREGIFYIELPLNDEKVKWVSKNYDAISFEKHDTLPKIAKLWNNRFAYNHISIKLITKIMYPFMMIRKIFNNIKRSK